MVEAVVCYLCLGAVLVILVFAIVWETNWHWERSDQGIAHLAPPSTVSVFPQGRCSILVVPEVAALFRYLLQQGLRLLQVGGVKPLGKPAIDWGQ
jgi:hypothetical protein